MNLYSLLLRSLLWFLLTGKRLALRCVVNSGIDCAMADFSASIVILVKILICRGLFGVLEVVEVRVPTNQYTRCGYCSVLRSTCLLVTRVFG